MSPSDNSSISTNPDVSATVGDDIPTIKFTRREMEIFNLLKMGKKTKQIAVELNISPFTVKKHRENMLHKTEADNMMELVAIVASKGLL